MSMLRRESFAFSWKCISPCWKFTRPSTLLTLAEGFIVGIPWVEGTGCDNDEIPMTNDERSTNSERNRVRDHSSLSHSSFFRHSSLGIRHYPGAGLLPPEIFF